MAVAAGFPEEVLEAMRGHQQQTRRQRSLTQPLGRQLDLARERVTKMRAVGARAEAALLKAQEAKYDAEEALAWAEAEVEELLERIQHVDEEDEEEEEADGAEADGEEEDAAKLEEEAGLASAAGELVGVLEEECQREGAVPQRLTEALSAVKRSLSRPRPRPSASTSPPQTPATRSYAQAVSPGARASASASSGGGGASRSRHEAEGYFSGDGDEMMSADERAAAAQRGPWRNKREAAEALAAARATRRR